MNREEELYELPEWVKFVNKVLHGRRKWEEEKLNFDRISRTEKDEV